MSEEYAPIQRDWLSDKFVSSLLWRLPLLFMAEIALLHRFEVIPFGTSGWLWIGVSTVVGALSLTYIPERISGKYAKPG